MLQFNCPACKTSVSLPDSARGERIVCGHCGESVFVAGSSSPSPAARTTAKPTPLVIARGGHRRRKQPSLWRLLPHVIIAGVTGYAAWRMYDSTVNRPNPQPPPAVVAVPRKALPTRIAPKAPSAVEPKVEALNLAVLPAEPSPPPAFADDIPAAVALPPLADDQVATLATTQADCTIELLTNSKELARADEKLLWKGDVVAGLRLEEGAIQFRWMKSVPAEAETAVRNSVIRLTASSDERFIALREPIIGEPLSLDLKDATHRVNGKCNWLPPVEQVRFSLTLAGQIPVKKIDGQNPKSLAFRDESIIIYDFEGDAATKVTMKKAGDTLAAVFASQYVLPSGDVEQLSISRGTRTMKKLLDLQADASDAVVALPKLRLYRRNLDGDLRQAQSMNTGMRLNGGGYFQNPVAVAQKSAAINTVQNEIIATERNLARAAALVDDRPAINADVTAMLAVEELAKSIDRAPLPYRFYVVVGGREVDLSRWAPEGQEINAAPAVLAQPVR